jgi:hypothetical protein
MSGTPQLDPSKPPDAYGQPISAERQAELQGYLNRWAEETDHGERKGPFDNGPGKEGVRLTGADVVWLAEQVRDDEIGFVSDLHLEGAHLYGAQLQGANLGAAHLEGAWLAGANLEGANLSEAHLEEAYLGAAHLEGVHLERAHLEGARLVKAHLEGKTCPAGRRAKIFSTVLPPANLRGAFFDSATDFTDATWTDPAARHAAGPWLADVRWGGANLTMVEWEGIARLQDEWEAAGRHSSDAPPPEPRERADRVSEYKAAGRAYRLLFVTLRAQGLTTPATRYHYRAEVMDRKALWHARSPLRWLFSWLLGTFAGYGDRLGRLFATYGITVGIFALVMLGAALQAGAALSFDTIRDTLVLSVTSFHGRGVQPPGLHLDDTLATLAGLEAVFGLLIEGLFIAAFTRRVTGG